MVELVKVVVVEFFILEKFWFVVGFMGLGIKLFILGYVDYDSFKDVYVV